MSEKRKDKRGRILKTGETQDKKTGRYKYTYYEDGKQKNLYSWRLNSTDPYPEGKREDLSLREKIQLYHKDRERGIKYSGGDVTVSELVFRYTAEKTNVRHTTRAQYKTVQNVLESDPFGSRKIKEIRTSDAMHWLKKLQVEDGKGYSSIQTIRGVLRPAFRKAVQDELIFKNPFDDFQLHEVTVNDTVKRDALSPADKRRFLEFVRMDRHFSRYYEGIYILFHTGMRISEFCGLTIGDLNMEKGTICINKQLQRVGTRIYIEDQAKTRCGSRVIPMEPKVKEAFQTILDRRGTLAEEPEVDGVSGFLCLDKDGNPMLALHWEHYFQHIREKFNKIYREPMPYVSPHVCRHTYCTEKAKAGMNPVHLAYLMGHSPEDIRVTMGTYTHIHYEDAAEELRRLGSL